MGPPFLSIYQYFTPGQKNGDLIHLLWKVAVHRGEGIDLASASALCTAPMPPSPCPCVPATHRLRQHTWTLGYDCKHQNHPEPSLFFVLMQSPKPGILKVSPRTSKWKPGHTDLLPSLTVTREEVNTDMSTTSQSQGRYGRRGACQEARSPLSGHHQVKPCSSPIHSQ